MLQSTVETRQLETGEDGQAKRTDDKPAEVQQTEPSQAECEHTEHTEPIQPEVNKTASQGPDPKPVEHPKAGDAQAKQTAQREQPEAKRAAAMQPEAAQAGAKNIEDKQAEAKHSTQQEQRAAQHDQEDIEAQQQLLKDIEDQCVSHGRHPAHWDNLKHEWVDDVRFYLSVACCWYIYNDTRCCKLPSRYKAHGL